MDFTYPPEVDGFRAEVRTWLDEHLVGDFAALGTTTAFTPETWPTQVAWEQEMGRGGWVGLGWPKAYGGREASVIEELVFAEEYARAQGPTRAGTFGEGMLGPTLMHFGTEAQKDRFLPPILRGETIWCQGFSEPGAGSDLAGLSTRARLEGDRWVIDGQKVWTSQAHLSDWIFVLVRTDPASTSHQGISMLLVPLDQPGIDVRPLGDMAGGRHFCEVFFDGAVTDADLIVGAPGDGWKLAMATLGFERGTAFMGSLKRFQNEVAALTELARRTGRSGDPVVRQQLAEVTIGIELLRFGLFRTVTSVMTKGRPGPEGSITKLQWSHWHQRLGEIAVDLMGAEGTLEHPPGHPLHDLVHTFLFARADTIYAGSSQVQRNIIGERVLGLPREPKA